MSETATSIDLNGEFRFKTDAKGRMSLPSKFRKVLPNDLVVTRDLEDECILVFEPEAFNEWVKGLFEDRFEGGFKSTNRDHRNLRRKLKSRAMDVQVDAAGRIMLPSEQRAKCGIERDVVIVGNTGYFEVWDAESYEALDSEIDLATFLN